MVLKKEELRNVISANYIIMARCVVYITGSLSFDKCFEDIYKVIDI